MEGYTFILTEPTFMTEHGITIGSTRLDVLRAYGRLGSKTANQWHLSANGFNTLSFTFTFDQNNRITQIKAHSNDP